MPEGAADRTLTALGFIHGKLRALEGDEDAPSYPGRVFNAFQARRYFGPFVADVHRCLADEGRRCDFVSWILGALDNVTFAEGSDSVE